MGPFIILYLIPSRLLRVFVYTVSRLSLIFCETILSCTLYGRGWRKLLYSYIFSNCYEISIKWCSIISWHCHLNRAGKDGVEEVEYTYTRPLLTCDPQDYRTVPCLFLIELIALSIPESRIWWNCYDISNHIQKSIFYFLTSSMYFVMPEPA